MQLPGIRNSRIQGRRYARCPEFTVPIIQKFQNFIIPEFRHVDMHVSLGSAILEVLGFCNYGFLDFWATGSVGAWDSVIMDFANRRIPESGNSLIPPFRNSVIM